MGRIFTAIAVKPLLTAQRYEADLRVNIVNSVNKSLECVLLLGCFVSLLLTWIRKSDTPLTRHFFGVSGANLVNNVNKRMEREVPVGDRVVRRNFLCIAGSGRRQRSRR